MVVSLKLTFTANTCQESLSAFSSSALRAALASRLAQSGLPVSPSDIKIVLKCSQSTSGAARLLASDGADSVGSSAGRHMQTTLVSLLQVDVAGPHFECLL